MKIGGQVNTQSYFHKIQTGFRILSGACWVSAAGFRISVAGLLGVAGFFLAVKDGKLRTFDLFPWSLGVDGSLEELWVVPGLQNLGNNCFLNVILQALASCSSFQSFLRRILKEFESLSPQELEESLPLTAALASLIEELCIVRQGREVLSPRQVMLAIDHYIPHFNLTSQQDAEEAFFHMLSALREELSECYVPNCCSLAQAATLPNCRVLSPRSGLDLSDQEKWRQVFLGPFDGILGSILTCQTCSFQISLEFQFFHSLHLSPVESRGLATVAVNSLEDCLRQFFAPEQVENYRCSRCWHTAALKYLSSMNEDETDISKVRCCSMEDSCDCRRISCLKTLPWSNRFSRTMKQLTMAHSPKILCVHLQRASVNIFGEPVKIQGHISFPLILNLAPFMKNGVGIQYQSSRQPKQQYQPSFHSSDNLNLQFDTKTRNDMHEELPSDSDSVENMGASNLIPFSSDNKGDEKNKDRYRLVSVVQHFGRSGSGHYTVYRRVRGKLDDGDSVGLLESALDQWFSISDSQVFSVSEKDVLDAEATLLFYEKILEN